MKSEKEYQEYLDKIRAEFYEAFPLCFPKGEPICGFSINQGWLTLVKTLCSNISVELMKLPEEFRNFQVDQVKEKFAGLRFYYEGPNGPEGYSQDVPPVVEEVRKKIQELISEAENQSFKICEDCGSPGGKVRNGNWMLTQCDECEVKTKKIRELQNRKFLISQTAEKNSGLEWMKYKDLPDPEKKILIEAAERQLLAEGKIKPENEY